jgi:hypothetical protein
MGRFSLKAASVSGLGTYSRSENYGLGQFRLRRLDRGKLNLIGKKREVRGQPVECFPLFWVGGKIANQPSFGSFCPELFESGLIVLHGVTSRLAMKKIPQNLKQATHYFKLGHFSQLI